MGDKLALDKIRILELGQLSFYVLFQCLTLPWCSLCSEPSTRLLPWNSRAVACGTNENGEWNSPLVPAPQRKDVKCTLRFCVLSKRFCGVPWCHVSLEVNGVGATGDLVSMQSGHSMPSHLSLKEFLLCIYAPLKSDESPLYCKSSLCISSNVS